MEGIFFCGEQFFRFFKDGEVLDCLIVDGSENDAAQISSWLTRETTLGGVVRGKYEMKGTRISFKTPGHFGDGVRTIDYSGVRSPEGLILDSMDHNTGRKRVGVVYRQLAGAGSRDHRR